MQTATRKEFYTAEEYAAAKDTNIAQYLMASGYELTRAGNCYKGKEHNSLVIRDDGRWYWNSQQLHGYSPINLLKHILMIDYGYGDEITAAIEAVKRLADGRGAYVPPSPTATKPLPERPKDGIILPPKNDSITRVMAYLCKTRGLDAEIVRDLVRQNKIYETRHIYNRETKKYEPSKCHNAVFVARDAQGRPQYAALRGTFSNADKPFKGEVDFSDKSYSFTLTGRPESDRVFCFESAIDAISHACIFKLCEQDWQDGHRISLGGTSFLGLERFLNDNPQVTQIVSCLDNDATGNRRSGKLFDEFSEKGYTVIHKPPVTKDFNQDLVEIYREQEMESDMEL